MSLPRCGNSIFSFQALLSGWPTSIFRCPNDSGERTKYRSILDEFYAQSLLKCRHIASGHQIENNLRARISESDGEESRKAACSRVNIGPEYMVKHCVANLAIGVNGCSHADLAIL